MISSLLKHRVIGESAIVESGFKLRSFSDSQNLLFPSPFLFLTSKKDCTARYDFLLDCCFSALCGSHTKLKWCCCTTEGEKDLYIDTVGRHEQYLILEMVPDAKNNYIKLIIIFASWTI